MYEARGTSLNEGMIEILVQIKVRERDQPYLLRTAQK